MQEQHAPGGIEWTRIQCVDGTVLRGFTWNPVSGCQYGCRWTMPDGTIAICYAEETAEHGVAKAAYPQGFAHVRFHPERLGEPRQLRTPAGIFLDSMSDLLGPAVPEEALPAVLAVCAHASWHTFQLLTKTAGRLPQLHFPPNVWVGASSPPDEMRGHTLSRQQQATMLTKSLQALAQVNVPVRWMSFEPLSWDVAALVAQQPGVLQWAVIGAASRGRTYYAPDDAHVAHLLQVLDAQQVPVFFKGNMRVSAVARAGWRAAFPPWPIASGAQPRAVQLDLLAMPAASNYPLP